MIGWMRDNISDPGMALYIISFMIFVGALIVLSVPANQVNKIVSKATSKKTGANSTSAA